MPETYPAGTGSGALAAGMDVMDGNEDRRDGWKAINKTRDYIAQFFASVVVPTWATLSGKPATFPPSSHTHTREDITNLPAYVQASMETYGPSRAEAQSIAEGVMSPAIYNRNITGTRRAVYVQDDGLLGYNLSRRSLKQNFEAPDWTPEQLLAVPILHYRYRAAVARERAGGAPAAIELGTIADDLHDLGLWEFVHYDDEGAPLGVHYELLGLAGLWLAQRAYGLALDNARRLDALGE